MNLAVRLACYAAVTFGAVAILATGVQWLVTPDPGLQVATERKPAPIPPRIAASIERRIPVPPQEPDPRPIAPAAPTVAMQEAPASLAPPPPPEPQTRAVTVTRGSEKQTYIVPAVTTARTDFPY